MQSTHILGYTCFADISGVNILRSFKRSELERNLSGTYGGGGGGSLTQRWKVVCKTNKVAIDLLC